MLALINIFQNSPTIFLIAVAFLSLLIGSFLNVIIFRLPKILQHAWRQQCYEFLETKIPVCDTNEHSAFKELFARSSHCLHCQTPIQPYDNIPLFSYLFLGGKCRACKKTISKQYPLIEGLTALLCLIIALRFGVSAQTVAGCFLTYVLIVQAAIDAKHTIIPDEITLPMIWIGLLINISALFTDTTSAIIGAVAGYMILWVIYWCFYLITKKEGMGYGDFKLLAMLGAWLGWQMLPLVILLSSLLGSCLGIGLILVHGKKRIKRIPFGPFLAMAGWVALLYGAQINNWYIHYAGLI